MHILITLPHARFKGGFDKRLNSLDDSILHINVCHERLVIVDNLGSFHEKAIALKYRNRNQCDPQIFMSNQRLISNVLVSTRSVTVEEYGTGGWQRDMTSHWPRAGRGAGYFGTDRGEVKDAVKDILTVFSTVSM